MKINKNSVVTFSYEMIIVDADGTQHQQVERSKPLTVLFGRGNLLEPFEASLYGLEKNNDFDVLLESDKTFGPHQSKAVHAFDKKEMLDGIDLDEVVIEPGVYLPMESEDGTPFSGQVLEITEDKIVLDFNHPLAGKDLIFKGLIMEVREANPEELQTGKNITSAGESTCQQKNITD